MLARLEKLWDQNLYLIKYIFILELLLGLIYITASYGYDFLVCQWQIDFFLKFTYESTLFQQVCDKSYSNYDLVNALFSLKWSLVLFYVLNPFKKNYKFKVILSIYVGYNLLVWINRLYDLVAWYAGRDFLLKCIYSSSYSLHTLITGQYASWINLIFIANLFLGGFIFIITLILCCNMINYLQYSLTR